MNSDLGNSLKSLPQILVERLPNACPAVRPLVQNCGKGNYSYSEDNNSQKLIHHVWHAYSPPLASEIRANISTIEISLMMAFMPGTYPTS